MTLNFSKFKYFLTLYIRKYYRNSISYNMYLYSIEPQNWTSSTQTGVTRLVYIYYVVRV